MSTISQWVHSSESPYEVLGVPKDADLATIKKQFRLLAKKWHPDSNPGAEATVVAKFQKIVQAHEILSDSTNRARYDDEMKLAQLRTEARMRREQDPDVNKKRVQPEGQFKGPILEEELNLRRQSDGSSSSKFEGYRGLLNNHRMCAICDTGADGNFVARRVAKSVRMKIEPLPEGNRPSFTMAHGRRIFPIAKATAVWQFRAEPSRAFEIEFFVLRDCIFDVMFGASFVYEMGLLSTNKHLSTSLTRPSGALHVRHVKTCGFPRQRLNGDINHVVDVGAMNQCLALPDSAAQPNIISYAYAAKRGWLLHVEPSPPQCRLLQFVDGSMEETDGRIWLYWKFGQDRVTSSIRTNPRHRGSSAALPEYTVHSRGTKPADQQIYSMNRTRTPPPWLRNTFDSGLDEASKKLKAKHIGPFAFDVLRGCPWDVIVGHVFLDSTDAFVSQAHCFTAVGDESPLSLNPVVWAKGKEKKRDKQKHSGNSVAGPPTSSTAVRNTDASLHDALEALALKHSHERKLKRTQRFSDPITSALPVSGSSNSTSTKSSRSSGSNIAVSVS